MSTGLGLIVLQYVTLPPLPHFASVSRDEVVDLIGLHVTANHINAVSRCLSKFVFHHSIRERTTQRMYCEGRFAGPLRFLRSRPVSLWRDELFMNTNVHRDGPPYGGQVFSSPDALRDNFENP